ncbi:MAG: hypothetical protein HC896_03730 [Bacteroidales bacterium]|nr:hypothetical protein [Bacteroidales bacterium]
MFIWHPRTIKWYFINYQFNKGAAKVEKIRIWGMGHSIPTIQFIFWPTMAQIIMNAFSPKCLNGLWFFAILIGFLTVLSESLACWKPVHSMQCIQNFALEIHLGVQLV